MEAIMLNAKKTRRACLVAVVILAMLASMVLCLASCGAPTAKEIAYVDDSLEKSTFNVGDYVEIRGAKIKVTYSDGSNATVDVTEQMVTDKACLKVGVQNVIITYTEGDVTLTCVMPVNVVNKNAEIASALAETYTAEDLADDTVFGLVSAYMTRINMAATEAEANQLSAECTTRVNEYKTAKAAAAAAAAQAAIDEANAKAAAAAELATAKTMAAALVEGTDIEMLIENYKMLAANSKEVALGKIEYAATPVEAALFAADYIAEVNQYLAYQEAIEGEDGGLIEAKMDIIVDLRETQDEFNADPWYSDDEKEAQTKKCQETIDRIYMALDLASAEALAEEHVEELAEAKDLIDNIYDAYMAIGNVHYLDTSDDRIEDAEVLLARALDIDYAVAKERLENYPVPAEEGEPTLVNLLDGPVEGETKFEGIYAKRERYTQLGKAVSMAINGREDFSDPASTVAGLVSVVDMIDAIGEIDIDSLPAIQTAYSAYEAWAKYYEIIDETTAELSDVYGVNLYDGIDENDKGVLVENYEEMFNLWDEYLDLKSTMDEELQNVKDLIDAIGDVMLGIAPVMDGDEITNADAVEYRDAEKTILVDSKAAIEAARAALNAFCNESDYNIVTHAEEYFVEGAKDYRTVLTDAEAYYADLIVKANEINKNIGRLLHDKSYIDPVADEPAINTIAAEFEVFTGLNKTGDKSYYGIIVEYSYYEEVVEAFKMSKFNDVLKKNAKDEITAYGEEMAALHTTVASAIEDVVGAYCAQIDDIDYDAEKTLDVQGAALTAIVTAAKAAIDEEIPE